MSKPNKPLKKDTSSYSPQHLKKNRESGSMEHVPTKSLNVMFLGDTNNTRASVFWKRFFILSFVLVVLFGGLIFIFFSFLIPEEPPLDILFTEKTHIPSEFKSYHDISKPYTDFQKILHTPANKRDVLNEVIVHPKKDRSTKVGVVDFLNYSTIFVPKELLKIFSGYYFVGSYTFFDGEVDMVFVAVIDNPNIGRESLRAWESVITNDINILFGSSISGSLNTFFSDSIQGVTVRRTSLNVKDRGVVYTITDTGILIISTSERSFAEIVRKINNIQKDIVIQKEFADNF